MKMNRFNTTNLVDYNVLMSMPYRNGVSPPFTKLLDMPKLTLLCINGFQI